MLLINDQAICSNISVVSGVICNLKINRKLCILGHVKRFESLPRINSIQIGLLQYSRIIAGNLRNRHIILYALNG